MLRWCCDENPYAATASIHAARVSAKSTIDRIPSGDKGGGVDQDRTAAKSSPKEAVRGAEKSSGLG
jgi:hypothetical protein